MADNKQKFIHLHLHTEYSLLDGGNRLDKLVKKVKELGMNAVAVTDHGNMHAAAKFYAQAKAAGIKPIMGIEAYIAPDVEGRKSDRTSREYTGVSDGGFHLVLLAENQTGWQNLLKLTSDAYIKGFYYKPRMDKTTLAQWGEGLIAINGHLGSSIAYHLRNFVKTNSEKHYQLAIEEAKWHEETFGTNEKGEPCFYIELQRHVDDQESINPYLIKLARELNIPLVCDNDSHFLNADDWNAHDSLVCISTGKLKHDPQRLKYPTELYVKSPDEMYELFENYGEDGAGLESLQNTVKIADRCNVELDFNANHAPVVKIIRKKVKITEPKGSTAWFKQFCSQFELQPFDSENDTDSEDDLKEQCDIALRELTEAGAIWRYGENGITEEIRARMDRELQVLADKIISAYFLICWDFVNEARRRDIPSNARGSGVGTMVGFCLGLSNACPVHYGLLFERFTDPDRTEYPDIDIDICQNGRGEIINYVRQKYGHVAQIITFGTLKARAVIRDIGRVMDIPLSEVDRIAKLIPADIGMTLSKALKKEPDFKKEYDSSPQTKELIDVGQRLEGMARHASVHAAGVVVATQPLDNIVPLYKQPNAGKKKKTDDNDQPEIEEVITQWDGPTCEKVGLLKMDFLGLRTLSIVERAKQLVRATLDKDSQIKAILGAFGKGTIPDSPREFNQKTYTKGKLPKIDPMDLDRLTFKDLNVLDLFRRGETAGVFQFESRGMRETLIGMKPDRLEDLIAANALFRPGPMDLIPDYNDRKHGRAPVPTLHDIVDKFTNETYGIMIYQEQVMQVVHELGGIPLRQAYTLIKAISKKKEDVIASNYEQFIKGADEKGLPKEKASDLFELIKKFAGYGFNKSHSTGYAIVAYQTAYLKTYFPVHYMAALLTFESISTEKVTEYMEECKRVRFPDGHVGIDVRPPDVNKSFCDFSVVFEEDEPKDSNHGHIRFGLGAVKGVGGKAVDGIIAAREKDGPFKSLFDFCERVPQNLVNKAVVEALVKCGAFDSLHGVKARSAMIAAVEQAMSRGAQEANLRNSDDFLFGAVAESNAATPQAKEDQPVLPDVPEWEHKQTLLEEKNVLGFYVSAHPLDRWERKLLHFINTRNAGIQDLKSDTEVIIGGMIGKIHRTVTRAKQEPMAILTIEDKSGPMECVAFPETFRNYNHLIESDRIVFIKGSVNRRREEPSVIIDEIIPVENAEETLTKTVRIILHDVNTDGSPRTYNGELRKLQQMFRQTPGKIPVQFEIHEAGHVAAFSADDYRVKADTRFSECVNGILQSNNACLLMGPAKIDPSFRMAAGDATVTGRIDRSSKHDDNCASIDRY